MSPKLSTREKSAASQVLKPVSVLAPCTGKSVFLPREELSWKTILENLFEFIHPRVILNILLSSTRWGFGDGLLTDAQLPSRSEVAAGADNRYQGPVGGGGGGGGDGWGDGGRDAAILVLISWLESTKMQAAADSCSVAVEWPSSLGELVFF